MNALYSEDPWLSLLPLSGLYLNSILNEAFHDFLFKITTFYSQHLAFTFLAFSPALIQQNHYLTHREPYRELEALSLDN